jgi:hypothetical protein
LEDGQVFDSTKGTDLKYRDGGYGVYRPVVVRLSGYPQPGICLGLQQALEGMTIGGRRTVKVPAALGFGDKPVLAPYAMVPAGSAVQYEIELLRVSSVGPDLLVKVRAGRPVSEAAALHWSVSDNLGALGTIPAAAAAMYVHQHNSTCGFEIQLLRQSPRQQWPSMPLVFARCTTVLWWCCTDSWLCLWLMHVQGISRCGAGGAGAAADGCRDIQPAEFF